MMKLLNTSFVFSAMALVWMFFAVSVQAQEAGGANSSENSNFILADEAPNNVGENLIDFTTFEENVKASGLYADKDPAREKTIASLTGDEVDPNTLAPAYKIEYKDFNFDRWVIRLNSSANTSATRKWSYAKKAVLRDGSGVLGARIHFPDTKYNAFARISPQYEIRAYNDEGSVVSRKKSGKKIGIIDNVGFIKKISLEVSGRNYRYGIAIRLKDPLDNVKEYFVGYVHFLNWRRLVWENPNYFGRPRERDLFRVPLYPREYPYIKFDSLIVYKPGQFRGGDYVVYFRKIDVWFDYLISPSRMSDVDIDDEKNWGILRARAIKRKNIEVAKMRERIELIREEERRVGDNKDAVIGAREPAKKGQATP